MIKRLVDALRATLPRARHMIEDWQECHDEDITANEGDAVNLEIAWQELRDAEALLAEVDACKRAPLPENPSMLDFAKAGRLELRDAASNKYWRAVSAPGQGEFFVVPALLAEYLLDCVNGAAARNLDNSQGTSAAELTHGEGRSHD